jgi:hypothetical protein
MNNMIYESRTTVQVVKCRFLTSQAGVKFQGKPCDVSVGKVVLG